MDINGFLELITPPNALAAKAINGGDMSAKPKNELYKKYTKLLVISEAGRNKKGLVLWKCVCDCGNEIITSGRELRRGHSKSCGCLQKESLLLRTKHNLSKHPLYKPFKAMHSRCKGDSYKSIKNYKNKGITVCERWSSLEAFIEDMLATWKEGLTLERINNNKGYSPDNCKWATYTEQNNNRNFGKNKKAGRPK